MWIKVSIACVLALLCVCVAAPLPSVLSGSAARPPLLLGQVTNGVPPAPAAAAPQPAAPAAAQPAGSCTLLVPDDPLTARGLSTPFQLAGRGCDEAAADTAAFVQAAVIDRATGQVSVYNPLVVDRHAAPAVAPVVPSLPRDAVVGIWVGYNGVSLRLRGPGADDCVQGVRGSIFGQNAFCNAAAFYAAAHAAIKAGRLTPPPLGTAKDGRTCPTSRDFSVVDQDQSDNTTTTYLVTAEGRLAQDTPLNRARLQGAKLAFNGSDERLVNVALAKALGCTPWTAPDLADPTHQQRLPTWPLSELQAAAHQRPPIALVPAMDPFAMVGTATNLEKLDAYRAGVDQPAARSLAEADTKAYCGNLLHTGLPRVAADRQLTSQAASPFPDQASTLFNFLALRFNNTFSNADGFLHCEQLLGVQNPVTLQMTNGVVTGAVIDLDPPPVKG